MSEDKSSATATLSVRSPRDKFPAWLVYSILTLLLVGIWGATSKAITDHINAYTNQVLFGLGMAPLPLTRTQRLGSRWRCSPPLCSRRKRRRNVNRRRDSTLRSAPTWLFSASRATPASWQHLRSAARQGPKPSVDRSPRSWA